MSTTNDSIFSRVGQLPVFSSAYDLGLRYYNTVKSTNTLLKAALDTAEGSVKYAADQVQPIIKFVKPLSVVDDMACKALVKLQERYPSINKTPTELVEQAKATWSGAVQPSVQIYESTKESAVQKMSSVKDYGMQAVSGLMTSHYGQIAAGSFHTTVQKVDQFVDYFMPTISKDQDENQKESQLQDNEPVSTKLKKLALKLKDRSLQKLTTPALTLQHGIASLQAKAGLFWRELKKELQTTEQQTGITADTGYFANPYASIASRTQKCYEELRNSVSKIARLGNETRTKMFAKRL